MKWHKIIWYLLWLVIACSLKQSKPEAGDGSVLQAIKSQEKRGSEDQTCTLVIQWSKHFYLILHKHDHSETTSCVAHLHTFTVFNIIHVSVKIYYTPQMK